MKEKEMKKEIVCVDVYLNDYLITDLQLEPAGAECKPAEFINYINTGVGSDKTKEGCDGFMYWQTFIVVNEMIGDGVALQLLQEVCDHGLSEDAHQNLMATIEALTPSMDRVRTFEGNQLTDEEKELYPLFENYDQILSKILTEVLIENNIVKFKAYHQE